MVISLPRRLRPFFRRRKRLTRLARLAYETIKDLLQTVAGTRTAVPGSVACLQSAGNLLDWHPHVHLVISWGLFRRDGSFIPVEGTPDPEAVVRLFRHKVLRMLLEEGAIAEGVVRNLLAWAHTGFGTHVSRAIPADATTPGVVARHMARPPITPERMLGEASGTRIIYRSDAVHPRHQANFRVFAPLDFLAEVSAHIPDAHEKTTPFYGWYSNRTRGYRKQQSGRSTRSNHWSVPAAAAR
jgi:Putative transposase